jgi:hypothetical protein
LIPGALPPADLLQPSGLADWIPQLHLAILAGEPGKVAFPSTAIFSRFPNENPEIPTLGIFIC